MIYQAWPLTFELENWPNFLRNYDGYSFGFFIVIKKNLGEYEKKQMLAHEHCHCRQFLRTCGFHIPLYMFSDKYRFNSEVEAYFYQIKDMDDNVNLMHSVEVAAEQIATKYNLQNNYNKIDAKKALLAKFGIPYVDENTGAWS